jgi:hypothetical protein
MNVVENYLVYLQEAKAQEKAAAKLYREGNKYMWLYHAIPGDVEESVRRQGLNLKYHGTSHGAPIEHPSGKPSFSYSTNKSYAAIWGANKFRSKSIVLLARVPTKNLWFAIAVKWLGGIADEYQSPDNIPPRDILFPNNPQYSEVSQRMRYLEGGKFF